MVNGRNLLHQVSQALIGIAIVGAVFAVAGYFLLKWEMQDAQRVSCEASLKQLAIVISAYTDESQGYFPPPDKWIDVTAPDFNDWCPLRPSDGPTYAMNAKLKGLLVKDVKDPSRTVMLFESIPGKNLAGGAELFANPPRHREGNAVAFVDGHVERILPKDTGKLVWDPKMSKSYKK